MRKNKTPSLSLQITFICFVLFLQACTASRQESVPINSELPFIQSSTLKAIDQNFDFFNQTLRFDYLDTFSGVSSNMINEITQDQFGLIWIATFNGLNRYDGKNFTVYKKDDSDKSSLINNAVWVLYEDQDGNLWIGTDGGLEKFDRASNSFNHYQNNPADSKSLPNNFVRSILEDSRGNLWIGTSGGGLSKFDPQTEKFITYIHDEENPYSITSNIVRVIYEDSRGYLWIGTWNGLDRFDYETENFFHFNQRATGDTPQYFYDLNHGMRGFDIAEDVFITTETQYDISNVSVENNIVDIEEDINGDLWLATLGGGIKKLDPLDGSFQIYQNVVNEETSLSNNNVLDIFHDSEGNFWFGTNDGLNLYDRSNDQFVRFMYDLETQDALNTLSNGIIATIFEDESGMYWIGTSGGGINTFSPAMNRFQQVKNDPSRPSSLSSNTVWAFQQDYDETLWIANDAGVDMQRKGSGYFIHYDPHFEDLRNENDAVYTILRASTGMLWIGTAHGLSSFNYIENQFITFSTYSYPAESDLKRLEEISITDLQEDSEGNIWIGTYGYGLLKLNPSTGMIVDFRYNVDDKTSISSNIVNSIVRDDKGYLWVGTIGGGLNRFNPQTQVFTRFLSDPENTETISDNTVTSMVIDPTGILWIGTYNGLDVFDPTTGLFKTYSIREGLTSDAILGIVVDDNGIVWMSTRNGLSRFDPQTEEFIHFTYQDGLQSSEFLNSSCALGNDGSVFFGGLDGYNVFSPDLLHGNSYVPEIVLTSITQSGEPLILDQGLEEIEAITLKWPDNYYEFEFSALNYIRPQENEYAYILENFDKDWNYVETRSYGRYTNLTQGTYTLRLIGSNNDGVWNSTGKAITIQVIPAWWESQWFRASAILLVTLAVVSFYRMQLMNIERYNRKLAEEVKERTADIERRRRVADGLREILIRLNSNLPVRESIDFIACQVCNLLSARCVIIVQIIGVKRTKTLAVFQKDISEETDNLIKQESFDVPEVVIERLIPKIKSQKFGKTEYENPQSGFHETYTGVPIYLSGDIFGGLIIEHGTLEIRHEELELLKSFADQVGLAYGNELLRTRAEEMAVVSERNRIARDLHDAITQTLFSANLIADTLAEGWGLEKTEASGLITDLRQLNKSALAEMRTLLLELRPTAVIETDLRDLLDQLANILRGRAGCSVDLEMKGKCRLPDEVQIGFYRIAQESVTNIMKHSDARNVRIQLKCIPLKIKRSMRSSKKITLIIEDNGRGFDSDKASASRFGLANMRQRAIAIGADLQIATVTGKGTRIQLTWLEGKENQVNG